MSSDFIASIFKNLRASQNAEKNFDLLNKLQTQAAITKISKAGVNAGDNFNGFSALNGLDDIVSAVAGSVPSQVSGDLILAELTSTNNSEIADKLLKTVATVNDIATLTGSSELSASGLLDDIITSAAPEAQAKALKDVIGATPSEVKNIVGKNVDLSKLFTEEGMDDFEIYAETLFSDMFNNLFSSTNSFSSLKSSVSSIFLSSALNVLAKNAAGFNSLMDNIVEGNLKIAESSINKLVAPEKDRALQSKKKNIISLIAAKQYKKAADIIAPLSPLSYDKVLAEIKKIDVSASKNLVEKVTVNSIPGRDLSKLKNIWQGKDTPPEYFNNAISNERELLNELGNIERDVTEVIIFSTNTPNNVLLSAEKFQRTAIQQGRDGTGYHYVITRSGDIQRGRPVDVETLSTHHLPNDHHKRSVLIVLVGGVDREAGKGINYRDYYSAMSYTLKQSKALNLFLETFYSVKPGIQVIGISEINKDYPGPHFDVDNYIQRYFNKKNKIGYDPSSNPPLERKDIV